MVAFGDGQPCPGWEIKVNDGSNLPWLRGGTTVVVQGLGDADLKGVRKRSLLVLVDGAVAENECVVHLEDVRKAWTIIAAASSPVQCRPVINDVAIGPALEASAVVPGFHDSLWLAVGEQIRRASPNRGDDQGYHGGSDHFYHSR